MIEVYRNTKIYVACPAQVATGGPELLHQLAYKLNTLGVQSSMVYMDELTFTRSKTLSKITRYSQPVHDFYKHYKNRYTLLRDIEDHKDHVLIVPETYSGMVYMFKNIRKVIWWLSVDNYFLKQKEKKYKLKNMLFLNKPFNFNSNEGIYHLAQSFYAIDFLRNNGSDNTKISYLSDYLNKAFLDDNRDLDLSSRSRKNRILYNPKKGFEITSELIKLMPGYKWIPIIDMTPKQVKDLLSSSKVYIDFGTHPGKDRFPREAAICGCCLITGKRGSAKFNEDVTIPDSYKFENPIYEIEKFRLMIESCFDKFDILSKDFDAYREKIFREEDKFEKDIEEIFVNSI